MIPSAEGKRFRRSGGLPPQAMSALSALPKADAKFSADTAVRRWRRDRPSRAGGCSPWHGECIAAVWRRRQKGARAPVWFPMSPLDTPLTFRWPLSEAFAAKRGVRGLGSVRRVRLMGRRQCPEFTLRYPPRITVRGQTVQGGSVPLRKAPLRSRGVPWSRKRPCGPLAFRRATEGSRVPRKMRGESRGG